MKPTEVSQRVPMPLKPRPIVVIGAGGIVRDAHLPAYEKAGFPVAGLFDVDADRATKLASEFGIHTVYRGLDRLALVAPADAVFDVAVPPEVIAEVLEHLPAGAAVLIQKPLGRDSREAGAIASVCQRRGLVVGVNLQLRYAPSILGARHIIGGGVIGDVHDMEVRVTGFMPWHLWSFLEGAPRVGVLYHSVQYLDLARCTLGEPQAVIARVSRHPAAPNLADTRCQILLDYGSGSRVSICANHGHRFGRRHQESFVKWEGGNGAVRVQLGMLLNYPEGEPDSLEYCVLHEGKAAKWQTVGLSGQWFPDAFMGPMASLMRHLEGTDAVLSPSLEDGLRAMAMVDAVYASSEAGGVPRPVVAIQQ
ncbi:MAG TPA: Gfo/Idh/MocA family oxidoreductase [Verrucomicrobiae bacterium]|nr:Gfo/Idh/MocA family oxidoreductase [Verrucomicrobiae bacterium]